MCVTSKQCLLYCCKEGATYHLMLQGILTLYREKPMGFAGRNGAHPFVIGAVEDDGGGRDAQVHLGEHARRRLAVCGQDHSSTPTSSHLCCGSRIQCAAAGTAPCSPIHTRRCSPGASCALQQRAVCKPAPIVAMTVKPKMQGGALISSSFSNTPRTTLHQVIAWGLTAPALMRS